MGWGGTVSSSRDAFSARGVSEARGAPSLALALVRYRCSQLPSEDVDLLPKTLKILKRLLQKKIKTPIAMKMTKTTKLTALLITALAVLTPALSAQGFRNSGGILLGGGYLEDPETAFGFVQLRLNFYEDDQFAHTAFLEISGHGDDAILTFEDQFGTFTEDGDISFVGITANYELTLKLAGPFSLYAGAGAGVEVISLDDRFNFNVDRDTNFLAQAFGGVRAQLSNSFSMQAGVRYLFREDFSLLGDQFVVEDTLGYELSIGFRF